MKNNKIKKGVLILSMVSSFAVAQAGNIYQYNKMGTDYSQGCEGAQCRSEACNRLRNDLGEATTLGSILAGELGPVWEFTTDIKSLKRDVADSFKKVAKALWECSPEVYCELKFTEEFVAFHYLMYKHLLPLCIKLNVLEDRELKRACEILAKLFREDNPEVAKVLGR